MEIERCKPEAYLFRTILIKFIYFFYTACMKRKKYKQIFSR